MEKGVCKCGGLTAGKHHNYDDEDNYDQVDHGDNDLDVDGDDDPGNGFLCGPDSDADGFPDEDLDCEERWNKKYQKNDTNTASVHGSTCTFTQIGAGNFPVESQLFKSLFQRWMLKAPLSAFCTIH